MTYDSRKQRLREGGSASIYVPFPDLTNIGRCRICVIGDEDMLMYVVAAEVRCEVI